MNKGRKARPRSRWQRRLAEPRIGTKIYNRDDVKAGRSREVSQDISRIKEDAAGEKDSGDGDSDHRMAAFGPTR